MIIFVRCNDNNNTYMNKYRKDFELYSELIASQACFSQAQQVLALNCRQLNHHLGIDQHSHSGLTTQTVRTGLPNLPLQHHHQSPNAFFTQGLPLLIRTAFLFLNSFQILQLLFPSNFGSSLRLFSKGFWKYLDRIL